MKITGEARLLLVMGLAVLIGGGAMVLVNKAPSVMAPPTPAPTPATRWTAANFDPLVTGARHTRGVAKSPRITLVEFGDIECPPCRRAYNSVLLTLDKYAAIKFVFHHCPLPMHNEALPAGVAAEAADVQGKFWPMFDTLYTGETATLSPDFFDQSAKEIGLNMAKFKADQADSKVAGRVTADQDLAKSLNIAQTPTFLIRDEKTGTITEANSATALDAVIFKIVGKSPLHPKGS